MQKKNKSKSVLLRIIALAWPYKWQFFTSLVMAIVLALVGVIRPNIVQRTVDNYIMEGDHSGMLVMIALFVGILILETILEFSFSYLTSWQGQTIIRDLRVKVFTHTNSLRLRYFDKTPIGKSITRVINDIESLNSVFSEGMITIISDILTIIFVLAIMFATSWKLSLVCLSTMPFMVWSAINFKNGVKTAFEKVRAKVSDMNTFLQERITGMRIVQIFNVEKEELDQFNNINKDYTRANLDGVFHYAIFFPIIEIIIAASLGLMVWYGAKGVIDDKVSLGALIAFPLYLNMLYRPVRVLADKFNTLQMGIIAAGRVFEVLDNDEIIENKGTLHPERFEGDVEFKNVWFSYNEIEGNPDEYDAWILKDVSFKLNAGKTMAIVGSTGSGKSTIINLLSRFYEIQKGDILVDGNNAKLYELHALRSRIAVVLQDVFLFNGSVLDNITLRNNNISRERVMEAAQMIGAHDFITALPNGYDYIVQERGATLSMGQRQLISFVRALVFDPDILILDEATSSVDPQTESVIQYAIEQLIQKRTSIIIAHRLSTIRHADAVMVLEKGKVLEVGSPQELLQNENGHYRKLYDMQFAEVL